ncbi:hypothetical protein NPIL_555251 [Nephila pilipes]|uniref:Uncharacterized protein n=1 Tax=Nephila pilipes TaxID=299642 RepID=A0A8X6P6K1_NEPPI|nr:hypothetical protein NPIL_555251 [Nephila pilipes]
MKRLFGKAKRNQPAALKAAMTQRRSCTGWHGTQRGKCQKWLLYCCFKRICYVLAAGLHVLYLSALLQKRQLLVNGKGSSVLLLSVLRVFCEVFQSMVSAARMAHKRIHTQVA